MVADGGWQNADRKMQMENADNKMWTIKYSCKNVG